MNKCISVGFIEEDDHNIDTYIMVIEKTVNSIIEEANNNGGLRMVRIHATRHFSEDVDLAIKVVGFVK